MLQIGDLIQRYQSNAEDRPSTIRNNSSSLRLLIRTVHGGDPDQRSSALLTGDLIRELGERRQQQSRPVDVLEHQFAVMWSKLVPSSSRGKCDFTRTLIFPIWTAFERIRRILSLSLMDSPTPLFALTSMVPAL